MAIDEHDAKDMKRTDTKHQRSDTLRLRDLVRDLSGWILVSVVAALAIHLLFLFDAPCELLDATWESGDVLGYCGSIIGAFATIGAMVVTIRQTAENAETDRRNAVKPLAVLSLSPWPCEISHERGLEERRAEDTDYALVDLPILLRSEGRGESFGISYPERINETVGADILSALGAGWTNESNPFAERNVKSLLSFTRIELQNLGTGPAINLSVRLESETGAIRQTYIGEHICHSPVQQLAVGDGLSVGIYADNVDAMLKSELVLIVKYSDCNQIDYEQRHKFMRSSENGEFVCRLDMNIAQVRV